METTPKLPHEATPFDWVVNDPPEERFGLCTCAANTFVWVRYYCRRCGYTWEQLRDATAYCAVHRDVLPPHAFWVDSCHLCEDEEP